VLSLNSEAENHVLSRQKVMLLPYIDFSIIQLIRFIGYIAEKFNCHRSRNNSANSKVSHPGYHGISIFISDEFTW